MSAKSLNLFRSGQCLARSSTYSTIQHRAFSSSQAWQKAAVVPSFKPTSSTELDDQLKFIREQIILPPYLSEIQRDLIFHVKHQKMLENDDVHANIGGEKFKLQYLDVMKRPKFSTLIINALDKFQGADWENIPALLEGLHAGKTRFQSSFGFINRVIQSLSKAEREDIILAIFRQGKDTGMTLNSPEVSTNAIRAIYTKAERADFEPAMTRKALAWCEQMFDLMEEEFHLADPNTRFAGTVASLARALELSARVPDVGRIEKYSLKFLSALEQVRPPVTDDSPGRKNFWLKSTLQMVPSVNIAVEALGSTRTAGQLKEAISKIKETTTPVYDEIKSTEWASEKERQGLTAYEKIFGAGS
ncbi:hypothetical protein BJ875DRAFT_443767 [Amylocarpus encephaloides]|uniref:Uncharacterized protein n=1 Tax=Amylocarpus encephaloides TaxID=45428 RepID=A0A9P8C365_9HELO|nr:hypothetical protein BJ875DRAFT_443767 [Amylocarpus encephaloides]